MPSIRSGRFKNIVAGRNHRKKYKVTKHEPESGVARCSNVFKEIKYGTKDFPPLMERAEGNVCINVSKLRNQREMP